jgi:hypothetical protein
MGPLDQLRPGPIQPSSAARASPNLGAQANAAGTVKQVVMLLQKVLPEIEIGSDLHGAVRSAINGLSKHVPQMAEQQGLQQSMLRDLALRQQQMSPMIAAMQTRGAPPPQGA